MIHGKVYSYKGNPFEDLKEHFCPHCGAELVTIKVSKVINSKTKDEDDIRLRKSEVFLQGNIEYHWCEYHCETCQRNFSFDEIREIERQEKKAERKAKTAERKAKREAKKAKRKARKSTSKN